MLLVLVACIAIYVHQNKERVFAYVLDQLKGNIRGELHVGHMETDVLSHFPHITVKLQDVSLRDSLWQTHKRDLLRAKEVSISVNIRSLLSGVPHIRNVSISDGRLHLFTDSTGYSNMSVFPARDTTIDSLEREFPHINRVTFTHVEALVENRARNKDFHFVIDKLGAAMRYRHKGWTARVQLSALVKSMAFNADRGSFLMGKYLRTNLKLSYDEESETLTVPLQTLTLNEDKVKVGATVVMKQRPATFLLDIKADRIQFRQALSFLTPPLAGRLSKYDLQKKIDVQAVLKGHMAYLDTPYVAVTWQVKDNTLFVPGTSIEHCTFTGIYNNERVKGGGYRDENAIIELKGLSGKWQGISLKADTVSISGLVSPLLYARLRSRLDITRLNGLLGDNNFHFEKGIADADLLYKGRILSADSAYPFISGNLLLKDAAMTYAPRNIKFTNVNARLRFRGSDLFIDEVRLQKGKVSLDMQGKLLNFANLYRLSPDKIIWDWQVHSPEIDLDEFVPLLAGRRASESTSANTKGEKQFSEQLSRFLDACSVRMNVRVDKVRYQHFEGRGFAGELSMAGSDIVLRDVRIAHAQGVLKANVHVTQRQNRNDYVLTGAAEHVEVKQFLSAFDNFGQTSITDKNISGRLSADVQVTGELRPNGAPVPHSIKGTASFRLLEGMLVRFAPLSAISSYMPKSRSLDSLSFRDMNGMLTIQGDKMLIHPMFIETNAINMHVQGTYAIGNTGTDISMDIPLRNPRKDEDVQDDAERHERSMKGIVLHLKAMDGPDGKVKIKWAQKGESATEPGDGQQPRKKRRLFGGK